MRRRHSFDEVEQLCAVAHVAPSEAAKHVIAALVGMHDAALLKAYLTHIAAILPREELKAVLEEAVEAVSGTEYELLSLLLSFLLPLLPPPTAAEATRLLRLLEFTAAHQTLLPQTDVKALLREPWAQLAPLVTWYNYPHYLLVFSLAALSMDQVLFHLLDAALAAPAPPEWLALSAFITSFPPVADACRLARACLAAAQKYQHPADERCATFPCPLCQDRIDASRKALELCHSALLNTAETTTLPEAEIDARSQLTRACRVELVGAVAQAQWARLCLGEPSLPASLRGRLDACQVRAHFTSLQPFLEGVFASAACVCGARLKNQYYRLCFLQWRSSQHSQHTQYTQHSQHTQYTQHTQHTQHTQQAETGENAGRKRPAAVRVAREFKRRNTGGERGVADVTSLLRRQRENVQQTATEEEQKAFVFNAEAVGCWYLHGVMEAISDQCGLDYQEMTEHAMEALLKMEVEVETAGLCEQARQEEKEEACVEGLVYMLEGFFSIDFALFAAEATRLLRTKSELFSPSAKYLLNCAVARVLQSHPQSEALLSSVSSKERKLLEISVLEKEAALCRVQENCQKFGIPVGGDVLAQVRNQVFLVNTIRTNKENVDVLWWVCGVVQEAKITDALVLKQLALACGAVEGAVGVKVALVRVVMENEGRAWINDEEVVRAVRRVVSELKTCAKRVVVEREEDVRVVCEGVCECMKEEVEAAVREWMKCVEATDTQLTRLLCDLLLFVMSDDERVALLLRLGDTGDAASILPFITCEGRVIDAYRSVFARVVRRMVAAGQFETLFLSDAYRECVNVCCEEPALLKAWIVHHIKTKQYKDAYELVVRSGWESDEDEMEALRDYVIEELKDESLLAYLLSFSSVCCKHDKGKQTGVDTRSRADRRRRAGRPRKARSAVRRSPPHHRCPRAASVPCSSPPRAPSPPPAPSPTPRSRATRPPPRRRSAEASRSAVRSTLSTPAGSPRTPPASPLRRC